MTLLSFFRPWALGHPLCFRLPVRCKGQLHALAYHRMTQNDTNDTATDLRDSVAFTVLTLQPQVSVVRSWLPRPRCLLPGV